MYQGLPNPITVTQGGAMMRKLIAGLIVAGFTTTAWAENVDCAARALSKDGKPLHGAAKEAFMKKCLRENSPAAAPESGKKATAQQDKMKACNAQAKEKNLKGDARKNFMKECLSG